MKYAFVATHRTGWSVARLCAALGVSRSGYYAWRACPDSRRTRGNRTLLTRIQTVHTEHREAYGAVKTWRVCHGCPLTIASSISYQPIHGISPKRAATPRILSKERGPTSARV